MSLSLPSTEQSLQSEEAHTAEQLQDVEEEKDDSNEEENKDSLVDDEEEKEDLGEEDEAEEDEEDSAVTGRDEERSDALDQRPPGEAPEDEAPGGETGDNTPEQPSLAGAEVAAEDTLRQRKSQHPDKGDKGDEGDEGPSAWWRCFPEHRTQECQLRSALQFKPNPYFSLNAQASP